MRRYIALYLPLFSIQHTRRIHGLSPATAIALTMNVANQSRIMHCSSFAKKAGIQADMTTALAKALCPALQTYPYEPLQDFKLLYKIGVALLKLSPFVALDNDLIRAYQLNRLLDVDEKFTGIVLDITGTERLYKSEQNLLKKIFSIFDSLHFKVVAGVSSTIGSAWALSRYGGCSAPEVKLLQYKSQKAFIIPPSKQGPEFNLHTLPVRALRIPTGTIQKLNTLGLSTIGSLKAYPPRQLALRFGTIVVSRLDQACGRAEESLFLLHPKEHVHTDFEFDPPLQVKKALEKALNQSILETIGKLTASNRYASRFILTIQGIDPNQPFLEAPFCIRKNFSLHTGSNSLKYISAIIRPFFEQLAIPEGVTRITLAAEAVHASTQEQEHCFTTMSTTVPKQVRDELLNSLTLHLGKSNVRVVHFHESFIPEKSYSYMPLDHAIPTLNIQHALTRYPATLFEKPHPIIALSLLPDAPPSSISWQGIQYKIIKGLGPERITSQWWQQSLKEVPEEREYFRVQDETGRWLWLFRERASHRWFLHGFWC